MAPAVAEDLVGVTHQVAVELVVAGNEHGDAWRCVARRPPVGTWMRSPGNPLITQASRPPMSTPSSSAEGDDAAQRAVAHLLLDCPTLLGEIAGPIRHHCAFQVRRYPSGMSAAIKRALHLAISSVPTRPALRDRRASLLAEAHAGLLIDDRWVEQCEPAWTSGGAVVGDGGDGCRTAPMPAARVGRSWRGEDEDRIGAVMATDFGGVAAGCGRRVCRTPRRTWSLPITTTRSRIKKVSHFVPGRNPPCSISGLVRMTLALSRIQAFSSGWRRRRRRRPRGGESRGGERTQLIVGERFGGMGEVPYWRDRIGDGLGDRDLKAPGLARRRAGGDHDMFTASDRSIASA